MLVCCTPWSAFSSIPHKYHTAKRGDGSVSVVDGIEYLTVYGPYFGICVCPHFEGILKFGFFGEWGRFLLVGSLGDLGWSVIVSSEMREYW